MRRKTIPLGVIILMFNCLLAVGCCLFGLYLMGFTTDRAIVMWYYGRQAEIQYSSQGRVTRIIFPKPMGKSIFGSTRPLCLFNCSIPQPFPSAIGQLTELRILHIAGVIFIPPEIGELKKLGKLELYGSFTTIPPEIGLLTELEFLDIYGYNQLKTIPSEIGHLKKLRYLYLRGGCIRQLPPEIGQLTNLVRLDVSDNCLVEIPPEIGRLTNLRELNVNNNQLTEIPPEIGKLSNLQELHLSNNQLITVPPEIGKLSNLQKFDLSDNQLTTLPIEITHLKNLKALGYVSGNNFTGLSPEVEIFIEEFRYGKE